jgi:protein-tyrosine phosphatase
MAHLGKCDAASARCTRKSEHSRKLAVCYLKEQQTSMIDLHSHLLPGIDDGCSTLAESMSCVRTLLDRGFVGTVCTPHIWSKAYPNNTPVRIAELVTLLQKVLDAAGLNYQLWAGGELRIAKDTVSWIGEHGVPTVGQSRYVLVDYWGNNWPAYADRVIEYLLQEGYRPILAHPERMDFDDAEWDAVLGRLEQSGVWLQGNLKCLAGREGPKVELRARRLLEEDYYRILATDMHGTADLVDRLAGLSVVEQHVGIGKMRMLLADMPQEIVMPGQ